MWLKFNSSLVFVSILMLLVCNSCQYRPDKQTEEFDGVALLLGSPSEPINRDSLKVFTPGKDGVPLPNVQKARPPVKVETTTSLVRAGEPRIKEKSPPSVFTPGQDGLKMPNVVRAIHQPVFAGLPDKILVKDPVIRDENPYNFITYGKLQGLKNNVIRASFQDSFGNLWFGTNGGGVVKFDGTHFYHFTDKEGLANNIVWAIMEDSNGVMWFGTWGGGISRYDGLTFTNYSIEHGLVGNLVQSIIEDKNGHLWVATGGGGLSRFDGEYFTNYSEEQGLPNINLSSVIQDRDGNIWIGTWGYGALMYDGTSFYQYTRDSGLAHSLVWSILEDFSGNLWFATLEGVSKFDGRYFTTYTEDEGLSGNRVWTITQESSGALWFGSRDGGVSRFDGTFFQRFNEKDGLPSPTVMNILEDRNGNIWLGTFGGGITRYAGKTFRHFGESRGFTNYDVRAFLEDNQGNLWIGTWGGGIYLYTGEGLYYYTDDEGLTGNIIYSLSQDHKNNIWIASFTGLSMFDGENFYHYTVAQGIPNPTIWSTFIDSKGNLWLASSSGIAKFDGESFTRFAEPEGLPEIRIWTIEEDKHGNLWLGSNGSGLFRFDGNTFTQYNRENGFPSDIVYYLKADDHGNIWAGTNNEGVVVFNKDILSTQTADPGNGDSDIALEFITLTEAEGLSGNNVYSIYTDRSGNLYLGTEMGFSRIDAENLGDIRKIYRYATDPSFALFKNFGYEEGFLGIGVRGGNTFCETQDGTIWIGADDRLTAFFPQNEIRDTIAPTIRITNLELFNESIPWNQLAKSSSMTEDGRDLTFSTAKDTVFIMGNGIEIKNFRFNGIYPWFGLPKELSLPHYNNFISFNFTGVTHRQSQQVKYQYKLNGFDDTWSTISTRNFAPYGNLPPGKYTFRVKAMNSEGVWSDEETFSFSIRTPWWGTWWFRVAVIIFVGLVLLVIYYLRVKNLQQQKVYLEKVVEQNTAEIKNQNDELQTLNEELLSTNEELETQRDALQEALQNLQSTQEKLIHSEKMASLGVLSAGVAHEINNPVNFIYNASAAIENYMEEFQEKDLAHVKPFFDAIQTGIKRVSSIVDSMGRFSRSEDLPAVNCRISFIIDDCLTILYNQYKDRIDIIRDYPADEPEVYGNEGQLHQAFMNILSNAVQAIDNTGIITIKLLNKKEFIEISISDTGHGIEKENLKKVFDPFYTTKEPGKGTGLGLSITERIINDHHGAVECQSVLHNGSAFIVKLPVVNGTSVKQE